MISGTRLKWSLTRVRELTFALTDSFTYDAGSYQRGKATMTLPQLTSGRAPVACQSVGFGEQLQSEGIGIQSEQRLRFGDHAASLLSRIRSPTNVSLPTFSPEEATDVTLKVFTVSGLEIMYNRCNLPQSSGYHDDVHWDVRDADGDLIANGVYIFQLSASPLNSTESKRVAVRQ